MLLAEILLLLLTGLTNDYIYALAPPILPLPLTLYALAITLFTLPYMKRVRIGTVADVIRSESIVLVRDLVAQLLSMANMVIAYTILSTLVFATPAIASTPQPHIFIALATIYASTYATYKLGVKLLQKKFTEVDVPTQFLYHKQIDDPLNALLIKL